MYYTLQSLHNFYPKVLVIPILTVRKLQDGNAVAWLSAGYLTMVRKKVAFLM